MSTPTHPLDGECPVTVTHWCETWRAMREIAAALGLTRAQTKHLLRDGVGTLFTPEAYAMTDWAMWLPAAARRKAA